MSENEKLDKIIDKFQVDTKHLFKKKIDADILLIMQNEAINAIIEAFYEK